MFVVSVMVAVPGLVVMIVMEDIDGGRYVDESSENLVGVVVTAAAIVVVAGVEAAS